MAHTSTIASQLPQWDGDTLVIEWPPCRLGKADARNLLQMTHTVNSTPFFGQPAGTVILQSIVGRPAGDGRLSVTLKFCRYSTSYLPVYDPVTNTIGSYPTHKTADFERLIR